LSFYTKAFLTDIARAAPSMSADEESFWQALSQNQL
jgi:hypothetical protein